MNADADQSAALDMTAADKGRKSAFPVSSPNPSEPLAFNFSPQS